MSSCAYYDPVVLNEAIVPSVLTLKTKDEQCVELIANHALRAQLIMLNNATQNAKRQLNVGRSVCPFKVPWAFNENPTVIAPLCISPASLRLLADYIPTHNTGLSQVVNLALNIELKTQMKGSYRQNGLYWCQSIC